MKIKNEKWLAAYRTNKNAIWIRCILNNNEEFFYDSFDGWKTIKEKCDNEKLFLKELSLQFRSHKVDIDINNCDGVYLIRSILGQIGGDSKNYYTTGKVVGNSVYKTMWMTPELIAEKENVKDDISQCFSEAIIYDQTKTNREK